MTRGETIWPQNTIKEQSKKPDDMNGYNRYSGMEMPSAVAENFNSLLRRISNEREKEQRLQACSDLRRVILEAKDFKALNREPFSILRHFDELLHTRMNIEMKREIAKCLGAMGYIMAHKTRDYLSWLFDNYERTTVPETKAMYMVALAASYSNDGNRRRLEDLTPKTLTELQKALERVESPQVLVAILGAVIAIATTYPDLFNPHWKDIVDIVVGWYVDTEQDEAILDKCGDVLRKLQTFWLGDMEFTLSSMLTHLLEDAETYLEDMRTNVSKKRSETLSADECFRKSAALMKAFKTILSAISEYFIVTADNDVYCRFVEEAVTKLTHCVESCAGKHIAGLSSLVDSALESLKLFLDVCRMCPGMILPQAVATCCQLTAASDLDEKSALAVVALVKKMISQVPSDILAKYVSSLIGSEGCIFKLRVHPNQEITREVFGCYKSLLVPRGVKCLQDVYRFVLGEMVLCFEVMGAAAGLDEPLKLPSVAEGNPWQEKGITYDAPLAEAVVVYLSNALVELASAKSSVIGMWALSPSLFQLLALELPVTSCWVTSYYPAAQYSLLNTLKIHCDKHDYFIANSALLADGSTNSMLTFAQSAKHFETVINVLVSVIEKKATIDVIALTLRWAKELVDAINRSGSDVIFRLPLFHGLVLSCLNLQNSAPRVDLLNCLTAVVKEGHRISSPEIIQKYVAAIAKLTMESSDKTILENLSELPLGEVIKTNFSSLSNRTSTRRGANSEWTSTACNFDALAFKQITDFLLHGAALTDEDGESFPWTDRLSGIYASCTMKTRRDISYPMTPSYLWHWAIWQVALFCVDSRLKTILGKSSETLLAIEVELKALANDAIKNVAKPSGNGHGMPKFSSWFRVRLLLNFVEILEKLMYNAYEGTAFALPGASKAGKEFFRKNKSTCLMWLNRTRVAIMTVALYNGCYAMVVRLGWNALKDVESGSTESSVTMCTEHVLPLMCQALLKLNVSYALTGLYEWSKKHLKTKLPWIHSASDQAAEKYEIAAKGFSSFLEETSKQEPMDSEDSAVAQNNQAIGTVTKFCSDSLVDCYVSLSDYDSMRRWSDHLNTSGCQLSSYPQSRLMEIEEKLSQGNFDDSRKMWKPSEATSGQRLKWSVADCLSYFDAVCLETTMETDEDEKSGLIRKLNDDLNEYQLMHLCAKWPESLHQEVEIRRQYARILKTGLMPSDLNQINQLGNSVSFNRLHDLYRLLCIKDASTGKKDSFANNLCLPLTHMARNNSNYIYAAKILQQYAELASDDDLSNYLSCWDSACEVKKLLVGYHASKLNSLLTERKAAFSLLCNTVSGFLDSCGAAQQFHQQPDSALNSLVDILAKNSAPSVGIGRTTKPGFPTASSVANEGRSSPSVILSKCMSTLASWLELDSGLGEVLLSKEQSFFIQLLEQELQITERIVGALDADCVVGALLSLSCRLRPGNCKSEAVLADWAYRTARKYIEGSSDEERVKLGENDVALIESICQEETEATKCSVVSLTSTLRSDDGFIQSEEELRRELESLSLGFSLSADSLISIWQRANYRVFLLYGVAADSYLKILHSNNQKPSATVTAALRLLRLLVKHFSDLQHFVSTDFASVPARAWKDIIPQLFARLNHPSVSVRNVISATLCQIADSHPELVAFPAVVGSMSGSVIKQRQDAPQDLFAATNEDSVVEELEQGAGNIVDLGTKMDGAILEDSIMNDAYSVVVNSLRSKNAAMVDDIKVFISELQRITLLRDEVWFMALSHMEPEVTKRLAQLQLDIRVTEKHESLSDADKESIIIEKRDIISKMIFQTLTDLYEATSADPQTPNERHFFDTYCPIINEALTKLVNSQKPEEVWAPFDKMLGSLYRRTKPNLDMKEISPVLAAVRSSQVPMPGVSHTGKCVFIESVCTQVAVLSTKTRPKKLHFIGSDGKRYTYLFKGLEDLHLDERMMQFLSVCNSFFDSQKSLENCSYKARHYSVTPLGNRSGLIQWVENAAPVFSLYKRWLMREAALDPEQTSVTRPSDLFRKKLEPLLRRRNINELENRHKWPASVLREVVNELVAETPDDLLQKEFWCLSNDVGSWWTVTQQFARSMAVMSVIGYLIGLGDRHLDNVLVDLHNGEIVHIDYNVCFEKGINLRVPERVPFRMTPNLKGALGPTGIEGTFRLSCEETLRFLRQGGEALLTLLEAFVYDPLVDWTTIHETGVANFLGHNVLLTIYGSARLQKYVDLGRQLVYRLFAVRVREIATTWMKNKAAMLDALKAYDDQMNGTSPEGLDIAAIEAQRHKALSEHYNMFFEVRGLIKSLSKHEDRAGIGHRPFSDYIVAYKTFSETLTVFLKQASSAADGKISLDDISAMFDGVYDGLLSLATQSSDNDARDGNVVLARGEQQQAVECSLKGPYKEVQPPRQRRRDERNVHALNVWRRVKIKLDGLEPDAAKQSTVAEQVDFIIREATSMDNLSLMYEGWTAWV